METISKRFEEFDICGKVTLKSKLWETVYPYPSSMCAPLEKVKPKGAKKKLTIKYQSSTKHGLSY